MATPHGGATYGNTSLSGHARAHLGNVATNGVTGNVGYDGATANHQARLHQGQYVNHGSNDTNTGNTFNYHIYGNYSVGNSHTQLPYRPTGSPCLPKLTSPHPRYQYQALAAGNVRFLALHCSGVEPEILEISIHYTRAEDLHTHTYNTLSYSWSAAGNSQVPIHVTIPASASQPQVTFQYLDIPINLDLALRKIRSTYTANAGTSSTPFTVYLWANSICVNWNDPNDVRQHNLFLANIFRLAYRQIIWLGPNSDESERATKFAIEAATTSNLELHIAGDLVLEKCKAFLELLKNPMFSHRALVAELALSYQTVLMLGDHQVEWQQFTVAVDHFSRSFYKIQQEARHSRRDFEQDFVGDIEGLPVIALVRNISNIASRSGYNGAWEPLMNLEQLISIFAIFDRFRGSAVQGLLRCYLPLARRESRVVIPENAPLDEVVYRVAASIIRRTRSLDILCQPWAPYDNTVEWQAYGILKVSKRLASWIRRCDGSAHPTESPSMMQRRNGDPLVSLASNHPIYNACGGRRARYSFAEWYEEQERHLSTLDLSTPSGSSSCGPSLSQSDTTSIRHIAVDGLLVGAVTSVSEPIADGVIPSHILKILGWDSQTSSTIPDKLLRSLVADRGPDGRSIPAPYATACKLAFDQISVNGHLNTTRLLEHTNDGNLRSFLKRVQAVVWNRRFFEVSVIDTRRNLPGSGGKLHGWGPPDAYRGQGELILCVLFGCSVPCILRKLPHDEYKFVGETYVYGLMDGEAVSSLSEEEIEGKKVEWKIV